MSQATRRNGNSSMSEKASAPYSPSPSPETQSSASTSRPSPYILLIYPVILVTGSLFSVLSPSASPSAYSHPFTPGVASNINTPKTPQTLNYFAGKQNLLNLYFVKIGWFWTTLAFILLQATTIRSSNQPRPSSSKRNHNLPQAFLRYSLITLSWVITTQWFFGPALIDRSFTSTGGRCIPQSTPLPTSPAIPTTSSPQTADLSSIATGLSCKLHHGTWLGGHDISGHFFMLVLSSAFLFLEFFISEESNTAHPHISRSAAARIARDTTADEKREVGGWETEGTIKARVWTQYFVWAVIALDAWMLLMTAIWFHTLFEKVSGLVLASASVWGVYFLPRLVEGWRGVIGGV